MKNYRKTLANEDITALHNAIPKLEGLWGPHDLGGNKAFVDGDDKCTIWIHMKTDDRWRRYNDNEGVNTVISVIEKYLSEIYESPRIGRSYIHRVLPGKEIPRHIDFNDQPYFSVCDRYQLFLNIPQDVIIETATVTTENTFMWFNHHEWHYYRNNNPTENLFFCVFDVLPKDVDVSINTLKMKKTTI